MPFPKNAAPRALIAALIGASVVAAAMVVRQEAAGPTKPPAAAALRTLPPVAARASIHFAPDLGRAALRRRIDAGELVIDLEALDSLEAALELADSWPRRHDSGDLPVCWVSAPTRAEAAAAGHMLAEHSCRRVHIVG